MPELARGHAAGLGDRPELVPEPQLSVFAPPPSVYIALGDARGSCVWDWGFSHLSRAKQIIHRRLTARPKCRLTGRPILAPDSTDHRPPDGAASPSAGSPAAPPESSRSRACQATEFGWVVLPSADRPGPGHHPRWTQTKSLQLTHSPARAPPPADRPGARRPRPTPLGRARHPPTRE